MGMNFCARAYTLFLPLSLGFLFFCLRPLQYLSLTRSLLSVTLLRQELIELTRRDRGASVALVNGHNLHARRRFMCAAGSRKTGSRESGIRIPSAFRKPRKGGEWDRDIQRAQGARNGEETPLFTTPLQLSRATVKCTCGADMQNKWREGRYGNSSSSSIQQRKKLMIKEGKRWNLAHTRFAPFQAAPHRSTESRTLSTARGRQGSSSELAEGRQGSFHLRASPCVRECCSFFASFASWPRPWQHLKFQQL